MKFDVEFWEIKAEDFQATFLILFIERWSSAYWKVLNF